MKSKDSQRHARNIVNSRGHNNNNIKAHNCSRRSSNENNKSATASPTITIDRTITSRTCDERISPLNLPHEKPESVETVCPPLDMLNFSEDSDREAASVLMALNVISKNSPSVIGTGQKRKFNYSFDNHGKENI